MTLRMNLMPWRERRRASALRRFRLSLVVSLVFALVAMLLLDQLARARLAQQIANTAEHQQQLHRLDDALAALGQLQAEREALLAQHAELLWLRSGQAVLVRLLQGVEKAMPSGARFTELSLKDRQLRVAGLAASASVVAQLMRDLQAVGVASGLELVFLRHQSTGDEFLLTAHLPADWS